MTQQPANSQHDPHTEEDKQVILKAYRGLMKSIIVPVNKEEKKLIRKAFKLANEAHAFMRRKSGEPYILHPIAVARICTQEMGLGYLAVMCALMHDVVEDTEITYDDIRLEFGNQVADIINGLTKIANVFDLNTSLQAENFRKLLLTLSSDVRVILIKIADRLHNMRTMDSMPRHKQLKIASETLFIYAPLAHRFGLYNIKAELEDLSLKYTEPEQYRQIASKLNETKKERARYIASIVNPLKEELNKQGIQCKVFGRPKTIFSILNKIRSKKVSFEEVYDLFAIRVVIDANPEDEKALCWKAYSIVTDFYQPNPNRLRDWISTPKSSGYESLHTTVMGPKGKWVEIQIRTDRMDEIAEKGFAAHYKYKEDSVGDESTAGLEEWLGQIREILKNPENNALDFLSDFKKNLFSKEIYVFTPKGDLKIIPADSTVLDFAYEIHSEVGNTCISAKVNHKLVPLQHVLENGDQVEIITSKKQKPKEDWLSFVVSGKAYSKIKSAINEEKREKAALGKEIVERKLNRWKAIDSNDNFNELANYFQCSSTQELFIKVLNESIDLNTISKPTVEGGKLKINEKKVHKSGQKIEKEKVNEHAPLKKHEELIIFGESASQINYKLANCCNPVPGDDIFGFISLQGMVKIHRSNCPNAIHMMSKYSYRVVKTTWGKKEEPSFMSGIIIEGLDDFGVLSKLTKIISDDLNLNMQSINFDSKEGKFEGKIMFFVNSKKQLEGLINRLKLETGIANVRRLEEESSEGDL